MRIWPVAAIIVSVPIIVVQLGPGEDDRADTVARVRCPCGRPMQMWSAYLRQVRRRDADGALRADTRRVPRVHCPDCNWSPGLLPATLFGLRRDLGAEIGQALLLLSQGQPINRIAALAGRPPGTVRDWCRRFREHALALNMGLARVAVSWGAELPRDLGRPGMELPQCLTLLDVVMHRLEQKWRAVEAWQLASLLTGGAWLATNTPPLSGARRTGYLIARRAASVLAQGP